MRGVNKVILIGNVGQDPECKFMPSGGAVTNISVATSETWKDKNTGQPQERTEWHRVVFFNKLGEIAGEYLRKGSKVYVEGALRTRKWQAQDGTDRYTTEIVASELQMLDGKPSDQQDLQQNAPAKLNNAQQQKLDQLTRTYSKEEIASALAAAKSQPESFDSFDDSDIPFQMFLLLFVSGII